MEGWIDGEMEGWIDEQGRLQLLDLGPAHLLSRRPTRRQKREQMVALRAASLTGQCLDPAAIQ